MFVMTLAMGMYSSSVTTLTRQRVVMEESALATQGAVDLLETLRHEEFATLWRRYNSSPDDDPAGPGSAPGARFRVAGLSSADPALGDLVGTVLLPEIEDPAFGLQLREDAVQPEWGLPRDLNGDSLLDTRDHADDYRVLPVRVRVEWTGRGGARTLEMGTILTRVVRP